MCSHALVETQFCESVAADCWAIVVVSYAQLGFMGMSLLLDWESDPGGSEFSTQITGEYTPWSIVMKTNLFELSAFTTFGSSFSNCKNNCHLQEMITLPTSDKQTFSYTCVHIHIKYLLSGRPFFLVSYPKLLLTFHTASKDHESKAIYKIRGD